MNYIEFFLTLQNQIRIYHWQTESYSEHKAFGETYNSIDDLIDKFIEVYIGKYNRPKTKNKFSVNLVNYSKKDLTTNINAFIKILITELPNFINDTDTDLLNIRDEMLGELNKLLYLLTLS